MSLVSGTTTLDFPQVAVNPKWPHIVTIETSLLPGF